MAGSSYATLGTQHVADPVTLIDIEATAHFRAQAVMLVNDSPSHVLGIQIGSLFQMGLLAGEVVVVPGLITQVALSAIGGSVPWRMVAVEDQTMLLALLKPGTGGGGGSPVPDVSDEPFLVFQAPSLLTNARDVTHLGAETIEFAQQGVPVGNVLKLSVDAGGVPTNGRAGTLQFTVSPPPAATDPLTTKLTSKWDDVVAKNSALDVAVCDGGSMSTVASFKSDGLHAGSLKIQDVQAGSASTDAATVGQLNDLPGTDQNVFTVNQDTVGGGAPEAASLALKAGLGGGDTSTLTLEHDGSAAALNISATIPLTQTTLQGALHVGGALAADGEVDAHGAVLTANDALSADITTLVTLQKHTTGVAAPGIGSQIAFQTEDLSGNLAFSGAVKSELTDTTGGASVGQVVLSGSYHGTRVDLLTCKGGSAPASSEVAVDGKLVCNQDAQFTQDTTFGNGYSGSGTDINITGISTKGGLTVDGAASLENTEVGTFLRQPAQAVPDVTAGVPVTQSLVLASADTNTVVLNLPNLATSGLNDINITVKRLGTAITTGVLAVSPTGGATLYGADDFVTPILTIGGVLRLHGDTATNVWYII